MKIRKIKQFISRKIEIDNKAYRIFCDIKKNSEANIPRLVIVSYLPNKNSIDLIKIAVESIRKFTHSPYELWVIDNNSPKNNLSWLLEQKDINLVLNRTKIKEGGSYANAVALEMAAKLINQEAKYFMALHQDIAVCRYDWLEYLLSKFNKETRAVGVRMDKSRVKDGILHVLGYIIDFQLFKSLKLNFLPNLPRLDVGDGAIVSLKEAGYKIFAAKNTIWDDSLKDSLKPEYFKDFMVDRSLNDQDEVFFLHLGRGVLKSLDENLSPEKSLNLWREFISNNVLLQKDFTSGERELIKNPGYSFRRYFVDKFYSEKIKLLNHGDKVLDVGGKKRNKRGLFNIESYLLKTEYLNIDKNTEPDYLADASETGRPADYYNAVIISEVLEHVPAPEKVLREAYRILKPGGKILATVPFFVPFHGDPYDFGRYTPGYFKSLATEIGFKSLDIEKQGGYQAVLGDLFKRAWLEKNRGFYLKRFFWSRFYSWVIKILWRQEKSLRKKAWQEDYTTGLGLIFIK